MNFFDHKGLGNHLLQLCPKVVKHPIYIYIEIERTEFNVLTVFNWQTDRNSYVTGLKPKRGFVTSPGIPFVKLLNLYEFGNELNAICRLMNSELGLFQDPKAFPDENLSNILSPAYAYRSP